MTLPSLTNILLGKQYIGIEHFSLNNEEIIAVLLIEKKKEELVISKKDKVIYSGSIPEKWDKRLPFFLIINTNQVIQKEVLSILASDKKLLHIAFPNTNWDEFYFEIWRLKTKSIVAISRKIYIEELLSGYQKEKIFVAGISLGVCCTVEIINYFEKVELVTNNQKICWNEENSIVTTNTTELEYTYNLNGLSIKNSQLLSFAGILRLLQNNTDNSGTLIDYSRQLFENNIQESFFSKGLKAMVGGLLILLLFNFFAFTHYYKLAQDTSESLVLSKSSFEEVGKMKQRIKIKEQKVKNVVAGTSSKSSLFINEITNKIPSTILLTELIYHPLEKKIKEDELILLEDKILIISGVTIDNKAFSKWIESIERLQIINQIVITHFGKNDVNETEFSIKLTLK